MLLGGISENIFENTVSVGQLKSVTGDGLAQELKNYMANCQGGLDGALDLAAAEEYLKKKRSGLAAAELLCPEEELPLLLDEVFAMYDDRRLGRALKILADQGRQVLLFTCQSREEQILKQLSIPYHKVQLQEESI